MFNEISASASLQRVQTDVHVKSIDVGKSHWLKGSFKIDSGTCGNFMPLGMYKSLYSKEPSVSIINHSVHLLDYNKQEIKQLGTCKVLVRFRTITKPVYFYVVSDRLKPIIGVSDALSLGLTSFHCPVCNNWHDKQDLSPSIDSIQNGLKSTVPTEQNLTKESIINHPKYSHLFTGIGRFKCKPVHITTRQNGVPVQKPPRKVPLAMKEKFKKELDSMEAQGIISKFDGRDMSPEWLNSFIIVKKPNGSLRICLDLTDLNKEIVRPVCNTQTMDDIVEKLKGARYFAVFDTSKGFFHVPLDQESKMLTAMLTPFGIYVYNVLAMGLSNATDLFETCIREILEGLSGVTNIADDVLIFGRTESEFKTNVISFLDRCVEEDMHLNPDKIQINCTEVPFFGNMLSKDGLSPDMNKVKLIQEWPTPTNLKELQTFLGTVNYLSSFLPFLSDLKAPLQNVLKKDSEFIWTNVHQHTFDQLKLHVSNDVKLNFYDSSKPLYIEVDTSKKGIGATMLQEDSIVKNTSKCDIPNNLHPISCASKTLSSTESNYSNIEHELLGVLFAIMHFKNFTYGHTVYVITDHKPLVSLFKKSLVDASLHLTHMLMQLLDYTLNVHYQPGERMHISDALSHILSHNMATGKTIKNLDVSIHAVEE